MRKDEEDKNSYKHHCQWCDYLNWEWVLITLAWSYKWLVVHLGFELTASCSADPHSHNWRAVGDDHIFCRNSILYIYIYIYMTIKLVDMFYISVPWLIHCNPYLFFTTGVYSKFGFSESGKEYLSCTHICSTC